MLTTSIDRLSLRPFRIWHLANTRTSLSALLSFPALSLAPNPFLSSQVAVEEGVLFGAGKILQYQKTVAKDDSRTYFLPNAEAMGLVSHVVALVKKESLQLGAIGTEYVGMQEYMEALAWPKDSDTGLR